MTKRTKYKKKYLKGTYKNFVDAKMYADRFQRATGKKAFTKKV